MKFRNAIYDVVLDNSRSDLRNASDIILNAEFGLGRLQKEVFRSGDITICEPYIAVEWEFNVVAKSWGVADISIRVTNLTGSFVISPDLIDENEVGHFESEMDVAEFEIVGFHVNQFDLNYSLAPSSIWLDILNKKAFIYFN